jgi:hypothetical protein
MADEMLNAGTEQKVNEIWERRPGSDEESSAHREQRTLRVLTVGFVPFNKDQKSHMRSA